MLRKGLNICCQHPECSNPAVRIPKPAEQSGNERLPSTASWLWHCPIAIAYKGVQKQGKHEVILPWHSWAAHQGGVSVLAERIFFVSTSHSFLNYLSLFLLLLLPRQRAGREGSSNPSAVIYACETAEKGRSEICVMGKNVERQRNGCRNSVLGRTWILGSSTPMIAFSKKL